MEPRGGLYELFSYHEFYRLLRPIKNWDGKRMGFYWSAIRGVNWNIIRLDRLIIWLLGDLCGFEQQ